MGSQKMTRYLHSPTRILKVYIEVLSGFSHVTVQMVSTTYFSLKVVSLKMAPTVGMVRRVDMPNTG